MMVTARVFSTYGHPLEMVTSFKYLGHVILAVDNNWPVVVKNLSRARAVCRKMSRILSREGAAPQVPGFFFGSVVQAVLLFGSENWVVTPRMGKALGGGGGVQAQVTRRLMGRLPWRTPGGKWKYTSAAMEREEVRFLTMEEYIRRRQKTVARYVANRSLLDLCEGLERAPGAQVGMRWWEQVIIDMAGLQ